ncbi:hypothetical protein GCM10011428_61090 [Streptomyces violaceus]
MGKIAGSAADIVPSIITKDSPHQQQSQGDEDDTALPDEQEGRHGEEEEAQHPRHQQRLAPEPVGEPPPT